MYIYIYLFHILMKMKQEKINKQKKILIGSLKDLDSYFVRC